MSSIIATFVTGLCPTGFISGTYGVGSCYILYKEKLQMGNAVLRCRDDHAATLISIETDLEEEYIKSMVRNISSEYKVFNAEISSNQWLFFLHQYPRERSKNSFGQQGCTIKRPNSGSGMTKQRGRNAR